MRERWEVRLSSFLSSYSFKSDPVAICQLFASRCSKVLRRCCLRTNAPSLLTNTTVSVTDLLTSILTILLRLPSSLKSPERPSSSDLSGCAPNSIQSHLTDSRSTSALYNNAHNCRHWSVFRYILR